MTIMTTTADTDTDQPLANHYLTFGVQYSREPHPYWEGANPNGWVLIQAKDHGTARKLAARYFGRSWCTTYDSLNFDEAENRRRYYPLGAIATITPEGAQSHLTGVEPPTLNITASDPEYHGVDRNDIVAVRIEGHLLKDPSDMYDVGLYHKDCAGEGRDLFRQINEEDWRVRAFELDWNQPAHCDVCEMSIT